MLQYPSIVGWKKAPRGEHCIAFNKYDGSNLRWEWNPKKGWCKYGTRRCMFDENTPLYNQAIELFNDNMGQVIVDTVNHFHGRKVERITAFTEFFGPSSFAGNHEFDEEKTLKLFDVFVFKKGFIPPKQFVKLFGRHEWCAEVVYQGNMNEQFIQDVRNGKYPVYEGVICKGDGWSAKIKTIEYLERLRGEDELKWEEEKDE
jgi:hypothetical protein